MGGAGITQAIKRTAERRFEEWAVEHNDKYGDGGGGSSLLVVSHVFFFQSD